MAKVGNFYENASGRYFLAVSDSLNFTRAAERDHGVTNRRQPGRKGDCSPR